MYGFIFQIAVMVIAIACSFAVLNWRVKRMEDVISNDILHGMERLETRVQDIGDRLARMEGRLNSRWEAGGGSDDE